MRCDSNACVGVLVDGEDILVWDTKDPRVQLRFDANEWQIFLRQVRDGDFDLPLPEIDAEEVSQDSAERVTIEA